MNMNDWNDDDLLNMYLTAYLLCLYEQTKSIRVMRGFITGFWWRSHWEYLWEVA